MDESEPVFEQETPAPVTVDIEPAEPDTPAPEAEAVLKPKKARKPLSEERKAQLREQLKKGRETSLRNRQAKAAKKKTFKKVQTIEEQEQEAVALAAAEKKIAEAESRKEHREAAKAARAEAKAARELAEATKRELDDLKAERSANKARKAKARAEAAEKAEAAKAEAAAKAKAEADAKAAEAARAPPAQKLPTGRELARMLRNL